MFTDIIILVVLTVLSGLTLFNGYLLVSCYQMYKDMFRVRKECEALRNITQNFRDEVLHIIHRINDIQNEET